MTAYVIAKYQNNQKFAKIKIYKNNNVIKFNLLEHSNLDYEIRDNNIYINYIYNQNLVNLEEQIAYQLLNLIP